MKRTKVHKICDLPQPDAILTSDWHLRSDTPLCRTEEEFQVAQWSKVLFIKQLQAQYQIPVLHAGDLFNHWKPSPWLLSKAMEYLPDWFCTIYGNHDLPQHSIQEQDKCGIFALKTAKKLTLLHGTHWGQDPEHGTFPSFDIQGRAVLIYHVMTYQGKRPFPGCTDPKAGGLLRKYPEYDLILTGHNHKAFVENYDGRVLVNPGSITRQDADQIDFQPRVYLYYADTNSVEPVYLPYVSNVVSRHHIERSNERSDRIEAFISKLDGEFQATMDFDHNLEEFFKANKIKEKVKDIIYKALEA